MDMPKSFDISPIGYAHSTLKERSGAPRQGWEGAPNARLEIDPAFVECLDGIQSGQDIWILTWGCMKRGARFSRCTPEVMCGIL
jgi:tRNA (Thr-GGU) A37 N-methylase